MNMNVTVLVLAAGKGVRFASSGGHTHKLQALLAGKPVMSHVLEAVEKAGLQCYVVSPAGAETEGMGDSIACGVRSTQGAAGWLILPADMPLVCSTTLRAVARALITDEPYQAVVPYWEQRQGHPVAFAASCAEALLGLRGDQGARSVLQALDSQGQVKALLVDDPGIVHDIDTLEDLQRAELWLSTH